MHKSKVTEKNLCKKSLINQQIQRLMNLIWGL